jgi:hypothetical protein
MLRDDRGEALVLAVNIALISQNCPGLRVDPQDREVLRKDHMRKRLAV